MRTERPDALGKLSLQNGKRGLANLSLPPKKPCAGRGSGKVPGILKMRAIQPSLTVRRRNRMQETVEQYRKTNKLSHLRKDVIH